MTFRHRWIGLLLTAGVSVPTLAGAQGPWTVTITPTVSPLPVGTCGPVWLKLVDPKTRDTPRNPSGTYITIADFDLTVSAADGKSVAGQSIDAYHWSACACQGAPIGTVGTITASYPGQTLTDKTRVPDVAFQTTTTFELAAARSTWNPPGCPAPSAAAVIAAAGTPTAPIGKGTPRAAPPQPTNPAVLTVTRLAVWKPPAGFMPGYWFVQVKLVWTEVPGAAYYVLWGPLLPTTGRQLNTTISNNVETHPTSDLLNSTDPLTGGAAPLAWGVQTWTVAAFFLPGPVSTAPTSFTKGSLDVQPCKTGSVFC